MVLCETQREKNHYNTYQPKNRNLDAHCIIDFSKSINFHANLQRPVNRQPGFRPRTRRAEANNVIIIQEYCF